MVFFNPSVTAIFGCHPFSSRFATAMLGQRCFGSSCGNGLKTTWLGLPVSSMIFWASWRMVYSYGLPMFTGSWYDAWLSRMMPSTRSST